MSFDPEISRQWEKKKSDELFTRLFCDKNRVCFAQLLDNKMLFFNSSHGAINFKFSLKQMIDDQKSQNIPNIRDRIMLRFTSIHHVEVDTTTLSGLSSVTQLRE